MSFKCDWEGCERKPYMEVIKPGDSWSYLCFWHYLYTKFRGDEVGYCKVDTDRELLENIREEIWEIQLDLIEIKEKLNIKFKVPEELQSYIDAQDRLMKERAIKEAKERNGT